MALGGVKSAKTGICSPFSRVRGHLARIRDLADGTPALPGSIQGRCGRDARAPRKRVNPYAYRARATLHQPCIRMDCQLQSHLLLAYNVYGHVSTSYEHGETRFPQPSACQGGTPPAPGGFGRRGAAPPRSHPLPGNNLPAGRVWEGYALPRTHIFILALCAMRMGPGVIFVSSWRAFASATRARYVTPSGPRGAFRFG